MDVSLNGRFHNGATFQGGWSIGRTVFDDCALNNVPQAFAVGNAFVQDSADTILGGFKHPGTSDYCHIAPPWDQSYQLKLLAVYPLPYGFQVSGVLQNLPGIHVITASSPNICLQQSCRTYTNAEILPSLGRNLAAGTAGTVILPIVPLNQLFEKRYSQLDLRLSRTQDRPDEHQGTLRRLQCVQRQQRPARERDVWGRLPERPDHHGRADGQDRRAGRLLVATSRGLNAHSIQPSGSSS